MCTSLCPCTPGAARVPARQAAVPPSPSTLTGAELPQAKKVLRLCMWGRFGSVLLFVTLETGLPGFSVREQGSPGKNTGACWPILVSMAMRRWSSPEEIPHVQGQRSPGKMVGGVNSRLESHPISTRDTQRAQTNLVHIRTQSPHRHWDRTVFECLLWRYRSTEDCHRGRDPGRSRPVYGISPLGGGRH